MKEGEMMSPMRRAWHWACCILPVVTCVMWVAAVVFLVLSWIALYRFNGVLWEVGVEWYIWNAVMLGILALYGHRRFGHGKMDCNCKDGVCVCE